MVEIRARGAGDPVDDLAALNTLYAVRVTQKRGQFESASRLYIVCIAR